MISEHDLALKFEAVKQTRSGFDCRCPVHHPDRHPSCHVEFKNGKWLACCNACGATGAEIFPAVGVDMKDLFDNGLDSEARSRGKKYVAGKYPYNTLYDYFDFETGQYDHTQIRYYPDGPDKSKRFSSGYWDGDFFCDKNGCLKDRKPETSIFGNVEAVKKAIGSGETVFYVEGEKDTLTLQRLGYTAFTQGSCTRFQKKLAPLLSGINLIILADNDEAGKKGADSVRNIMLPYAKSVKAIVPCPDIEKGDITDFFDNGHDRSDFETLIDSYCPQQRTVLDESSAKKNNDVLDRLIAANPFENYGTSDQDVAKLFSDVFSDRNRYCTSRKEWLFYDGARWTLDLQGMQAARSAKALSEAFRIFLSTMPSRDNQANEFKFVAGLLSYSKRKQIVEDAKSERFITEKMLDADDYLINLKNCCLDISGDEIKVVEHSPGLLLSKMANASYNPGAGCRLWEKTVNEIFEGDSEKIEYMQKICGMCLCGYVGENKLFILYGPKTRNGKSTFVETVSYVLGDYSESLRPESLAVKQNKDSRQASPDIASLKGTRLVIASEPPKRMLLDTALVKNLTSHDQIKCRRLYEAPISFYPTFKILMNTNYLPVITDQTVFTSDRISVIEFNHFFAENERNKHLNEQLKAEADGIMNWMLDGWILFRREGLEPPANVKEATEQYVSASDKILMFFGDCCEKDTGQNISAGEAYRQYSEWCSGNGMGVDSKSNFMADLRAKGLLKQSGTIGGVTVRNIIPGFKFNEFTSVGGKNDVPF